ncbi:MAG: hypothetical protein JWM57_76 [Phycisphaerales bacterium]|nr:hypothetical protein [Phycisphaerales bacterium]
MDEGFIELGTRGTWGGTAAFGLTRVDRRQHLFVIGKSGTGKTTLLLNAIVAAIEAGEGIALLDPHGDLAAELLDHIPPSRTHEVVYFDPADLEHPIGLNLLAASDPETRHLVVSGIIGAFKGIWGENWGPRLEYILAMCLSALIECQNVTLLGVPRMLIDDRYRDWVIRQVTDSAVLQFWTGEFAQWDERFRAEAIAPIQNKVGRLLLSPVNRAILGQVKSKLDFRFMMDRRRIFIANLSKGRLGADTSNLLGALLVTQFQLASMGRANIPEAERVDFTLVADEFQNFATDDFAGMLSESRKYRLALILATQFEAQIARNIRDAVFGNVGTLISFRVGESDAAVLMREFGNDYTLEHFTDLANHEVAVRLLDHGMQRAPFQGKTNRPAGGGYGRGHAIHRRSREQHGLPRSVVEDKLRRWHQRR